MERQKPRSRKKKQPKIGLWIAVSGGILGAAALIAAGVYIQVGKKYETVFFPNTTINGVNASDKTVEEVKALIASGIDGYSLTIAERGGESEPLEGNDIGLESVFDGSLEELLAAQNPNEWWNHKKEPQTFEIGTMIQYDEDLFQTAVSGLNCFNEDKVIEPENAYVSEYVSGQGYSVIPEVAGTRLNRELVEEGISEAVINLKQEINLEEMDAYIKPEVTSDNEVLTARAEELNKYVNVTITYTFGENREVLNGDTISGWLGEAEDGSIYVDSGSITEYVKGLASQYDTYNQSKTLKTSYGNTIKITGGIYGWRLDQSAEADELAALIRAGESQTREPVYKQKAASHSGNDYGSTYVEINLTAQHLFFYKDGKLLVESDFVSGNQSRGWATPGGAFPLTYKQRNAVLKGENYKTPVDYWMPFNGGIGLHDAKWRSSFGGTIYKNGGSHGCVNLPHSVAKTIYENISAGMPVLCYFLDGTEQKTATNTNGTPVQTTAAPAETPATAPAETTVAPAETAPTETSPAGISPAPQETSSGSSAGPGDGPGGSGGSGGGPGGSGGPSGPGDSSGTNSPVGPGLPTEETKQGVVGPGV
mgnify:CR=1 FL=1